MNFNTAQNLWENLREFEYAKDPPLRGILRLVDGHVIHKGQAEGRFTDNAAAAETLRAAGWIIDGEGAWHSCINHYAVAPGFNPDKQTNYAVGSLHGWYLLNEGEAMQPGDGFWHPEWARWIDFESRPQNVRDAGDKVTIYATRRKHAPIA